MGKKVALLAIIVGAIGIVIGSYSIIYVINSLNTISKDIIDISKAAKPLGDENAPITIIAFGDYQCEHCHRWHIDNKQSLNEYIDNKKVNFYFLDLPFLGKDSYIAAEATYCAEEQGKYWEYHDILYKSQKGVDDGWADKANLLQFAYQLGLETLKFKECLDDNRYKDRVEYNKSVGINNGVKETPTFFIINNANKEVSKVAGNQPIDTFNIDSNE